MTPPPFSSDFATSGVSKSLENEGEALVRPRLAAVAVATGCAALAARPLLVRAVPDPTLALVVLFVVLAGVGLAWRRRPEPGRGPGVARGAGSRSPMVTPLLLGIGAFAAGRLLAGGQAPAAATGRVIALNTLAAIGEEAFFRGLVHDVLTPAGAAFAVAGSAFLFAAVHVTVYGAWVLPIDLAAGLVLGWQRWASGSWSVPAVTHAVANLLVVV